MIIGVNDYGQSRDSGISDLKYAAADARGLYEMLRDAPGGFEENRMVLVADGEDMARTPTRANIFCFLRSYLGLAGEDDTALVYFGGHGTVVEDRLYLLPSDVRLSALEETGIAYAKVREILDDCRAKQKVVILDACHSGTGKGFEPLSQPALAGLEAAGTIVLSSCRAEELSFEMDDKGQGTFSYYLLQGLTGKADSNGDGAVGAFELVTFTYDKTRLWAAGKGLKQNPWWRGEGSGEIPLVSAGGAMPDVTTRKALPIQGVGTLRFSKDEDGVIHDSQTSLERYVWPDKNTTWRGARRRAENLSIAGTEWRMPTTVELRALLQPGVYKDNFSAVFGANVGKVWSSTKVPLARQLITWGGAYGGSHNAFFFEAGEAHPRSGSTTRDVRAFAVRDAQ